MFYYFYAPINYFFNEYGADCFAKDPNRKTRCTKHITWMCLTVRNVLLFIIQLGSNSLFKMTTQVTAMRIAALSSQVTGNDNELSRRHWNV
jgi:hypothetical protein